MFIGLAVMAGAYLASIAFRFKTLAETLERRAMVSIWSAILPACSPRSSWPPADSRAACASWTRKWRPSSISGAGWKWRRNSNRELQVFRLLGAGRSTLEIGVELRLSPKTVETYRENLKLKLNLRDAPALLRAAPRWGEFGRLNEKTGHSIRQANSRPCKICMVA